MVIGKIKPAATIVAQFAAGVEIEAIQHEGKMFLPVVGMGEFSTKEVAPTRSTPTKEESKSSTKEEKREETSSKSYTKEELMEMESKELVKICKNEFDIDPDDFDGKNTNKKLRDLILNAQSNGTTKKVEDAEEVATDADTDVTDEKDEDLADKVAELLEDFDAGKKNKKKTVSAISSLVEGDVDTEKVGQLLDDFAENAEADIDDTAEEIATMLVQQKDTPKKAPSKRKKKEDNLVAPEDLEVGDRVSVWWDDDNQEWFDGEVKSIKKGKIMIAYDDDTEELLDSEVHTKIKRLAK